MGGCRARRECSALKLKVVLSLDIVGHILVCVKAARNGQTRQSFDKERPGRGAIAREAGEAADWG